jgi:DNA-binding MarR family transcriptional regulator
MDAGQAELLGDRIVSLFPLVRRRLLPSREEHEHLHVSNLWHRVLGMLQYSGVLPMSEIGRRLCVSKPHMTSLINLMVKEGLVKRQPDDNDRRIINIMITRKGCSFLAGSRKKLKENIKKNLSSLSNADIKLLADSLESIRKVLSKLEEK